MPSSEISLRLGTEPAVCATLEQIARQGGRRVLQQTIEDEVAEYIQAHRDHLDAYSDAAAPHLRMASGYPLSASLRYAVPPARSSQ